MRVGSLFAGIGGFDLGFERAGMQTVWQVEQNAYCRAVLARHFPDAQRFEDVREVGAAELAPVDVCCGGFPCQPVSHVGNKLAQEDDRWLWPEFARIVGELRPRYVVVENVSALLGRGFGDVVGDLAALGYDAEWDCLPASSFGAPHRRDRVWIVAYPHEAGRPDAQGGAGPTPRGRRVFGSNDAESRAHVWPAEPRMDRVVDGVPNAVDRVGALGNALIPQIAQWIGERIMSYEQAVETAEMPEAA